MDQNWNPDSKDPGLPMHVLEGVGGSILIREVPQQTL